MDIPTSNHHVGSTERVFVAHVNDLNDFYLHSESVHDSLIKLGGDLYNEYSESLTKSTDLNKSFRVNDYCVCPSDSEDWYRGLIRQLDSNGLATVFKIDYGDVQDVPIQFLQPLKEQYFKIPRLAFHCSLANLLKPNDGWPIDIIKEFRSRLTTTFLYAQFMNYNEIRDISDVEITEKSSKTSLNKDFEQYQLDSSTLKINDKLIYKDIPMDSLDSIQPNQIRLLYYLNPSQFYVYFPDKTNSHLSFQTDLQNAIQYFRPLSSTVKHQPIVVKDNQAIWHRAIALDPIPNKQKLTVYFLDIGRREYVSMENIRALSEEFYRKPAFAIPCSLSNLCPMNSNEQTWKSNDPVHSEFNRLMVHTLSCHVRCKHDQLIYDVEIDIPKIGDLATFLVNKQLVSRSIMRSSQPTRYSSGQPPQNTFVRQQLVDAGLTPFRAQQQGQQRFSQTNPIRMTNPTVQTSSSIPTVPPQDGSYKIIQIRNAGEFYGLSQSRESEYMAVSKRLTDYYNNLSNESLLRDNLIMEGMPYAIQDGDKYHRVIVKHRDSETRVTVKFVDRGDESFVDITELLQIEPALSKIPAFAQPFRLRGYEDSQNSSNMTQNLKKLISNQIVRITPSGQSHNGCYDVEVSTNNNQSVNRIILNNEKLPIQQSTSSSLNRPSGTHIESQVFSNSSRHNQNQDFQGSRTNDTLPAPQKILTAQPQVNRFGAGPNQTSSSSNEQTPRFASFANRNTSTQNNEPNKPGFHTSQQPFGRQPQNSMQRNDENRPATNTNNRFQSDGFGNHQQSTFDQKRSFNNNNNERNDSGSRPGGSFSNRGRGEGFERSDRFTNRNNNEERNENNSYSSSSTGAFQRRGGGAGGGYHDSNNGNRGGGSHGEYGGHRDYGDNNDSGRRGGRGSYQDFSNGNRGGGSRGGGSHGEYRGHRDYGDNNDSGQRGGRGGRGGPRGGPHSDRGGASFRTRGDSDLQLSSGAPTSTFSNYPNARIPVQFDSGNEFPETILPKELFKFVVSYIETANDFFIQSVSKGDELSSLNETLQVEYRKSPEMGLSSYKKDQACLAKSTTYGCWYRAIVLSTGVSQVKIRFVDFGDVQDVDSANIRPIAKEHCSKSPYAYPCTFSNVEVVKETEKEKAISQCEEKEFNGKILNKTSEGKYILECDSLLQALISINAIKETKAIEKISKPTTTICSIVHVEVAEREFYVQEDLDTVDAIADLVAEEDQTNSALSIDEVNQLEANTIIIAKYNEEPFRAIIKSKESDEQLSVYFVDYGNTSSCPIDSTKRASEKLSKYPYQAKRCRLHGIPSDKLDKAYERLSEQADDEAVEISIIDEKDQASNVLVYIENQCLNEQFGYNPNQSAPTEQNTLATNAEETVPETNVEETIPATNVEETTSSTNVEENTADVEEMAPSTDVEQKPVESVEEEQTKDSTSKTRSARLVHVEKARPYVYLQFMPECDDNLGEINDIIAHIVDENKRNSTYEVDQKIVAKFSEDEQHYRARIESYSSSTETYKIYFLDYGNMDENVTSENFYSYSEQLEAFEGQAHGYLLGNIPSDQWTDEKRLLVESYINSDVQFKFIDENQSTIHIEFPDAEQIYSNEINQSTLEITNDDKKILQANICSADKSSFYIHILPEDNLHLGEIEELLQTCEKQKQDSWSINDKCLVANENDKYFRGQIREICDNKYDVQCIDYGSILTNRTVDQLFQLPNDDLCQQQALAHQCRLFNYADDDQQENLINQRIRTIPDVETVKIVVENRTDSCLYVTVIRENNENINQQESDKDMNGETSHISQSLSTLSITNNQTIDFGENDTSTTTLVDQTNNSMLTD